MPSAPRSRLPGDSLRPILAAVIVVAMLVVIALLDRGTGLFHLTMLYVAPILVATYAFGLIGGLITGAAALLEVVTSHSLSHSPTLVADVTTDFVLFLFVAIVIDRLRTQLRTIRALESRRDFDLGLAREVQNRLLSAPPDDDRFDIASRLDFAREVGGDYYRFAELNGHLLLFAGDISGKGMSAALFAVHLDDAIKDALAGFDGLSSLVKKLNERMYASMPAEMFVTMFVAEFGDDAVCFINCGHVRPLASSAMDRSVVELSAAGTLPLGINDTIAADSASRPFMPGDTVLVCSDGVTESPRLLQDPASLAEAFEQAAPNGPQAVVDRVTTLAESQGQTDDVTVICVQRR